jgi:hypothetical protein
MFFRHTLMQIEGRRLSTFTHWIRSWFSCVSIHRTNDQLLVLNAYGSGLLENWTYVICDWPTQCIAQFQCSVCEVVIKNQCQLLSVLDRQLTRTMLRYLSRTSWTNITAPEWHGTTVLDRFCRFHSMRWADGNCWKRWCAAYQYISNIWHMLHHSQPMQYRCILHCEMSYCTVQYAFQAIWLVQLTR